MKRRRRMIVFGGEADIRRARCDVCFCSRSGHSAHILFAFARFTFEGANSPATPRAIPGRAWLAIRGDAAYFPDLLRSATGKATQVANRPRLFSSHRGALKFVGAGRAEFSLEYRGSFFATGTRNRQRNPRTLRLSFPPLPELRAANGAMRAAKSVRVTNLMWSRYDSL
jgi:hypothetical protein